MRILYLSLSYVPSRRASSVQVMRMCSAMAKAGHEVTLLAKRSEERSSLADHTFYGVPPAFELHKLPRPKQRGGGVLFSVGLWLKATAEETFLSGEFGAATYDAYRRLINMFGDVVCLSGLRWRLWTCLLNVWPGMSLLSSCWVNDVGWDGWSSVSRCRGHVGHMERSHLSWVHAVCLRNLRAGC
ncbi:MAG: hypothetical protein HC863_01115 [Myxococcales bacterium]|nr:hypothetical protein [Myxococcales bacterium]